MSEQQTNDGPEWVPYQPPPPSGAERAWMMVRRAAFPVILLLFVGGLAALLVLSPEMETGGQTVRQLLGLESSVPPSVSAPRTQAAPSDTGGATSSGMPGPVTGTTAAGSEPLGSGFADLSVFSEPTGATVLIDGDSIGTTPLNRYPIRSGVYIITVERDSFFSADTVAVLRNNQAPTYAVTLNPRPELPADEPASSTGAPDIASEPDRAPSPPPPSSETTAPPPAEPAPTTGTLRLTSTPSGAQVEVDGTPVGTTPLTLESIEAGAREVVFRREGYIAARRAVTVVAGQEQAVQAALTPQMGRLRVLAQPWGSIYIDGDLHERNADVWYETEIAAGEHEVSVVHPALGQHTRTVTVPPGEQVALTIDLRTPPPSATDDTAGTVPPDTTRGPDSS